MPNWSFEDTVQCPNSGGQVGNAASWIVGENTPDYFNSCCILPSFSVPNNTFSVRNAATGNAYCGFFTYSTVGFYREKISVQLLQSLSSGTRYYVSAKVSAVSTIQNQLSNCATNKLSFRFSNIQYSLNNIPPTDNFAQFYSDSIFTDTVGWALIKGTFIADSNYNYLCIGNFFVDSLTDTLHFFNYQAFQSYYFIDDVCVSTDSSLCYNPVGIYNFNFNSKPRLYPNPARNNLTIHTGSQPVNKIKIYNSNGEIVKSFNNYYWKDDLVNLDISQFNNGLYLALFYQNQKQTVIKFIINK